MASAVTLAFSRLLSYRYAQSNNQFALSKDGTQVVQGTLVDKSEKVGTNGQDLFIYTYDIDKYRDVLRGFYIDMEKELPGPLVYSTKEVIEQIKNIDEMTQKYAQRYEEFYQRFCSIDDGQASKRACEAVFK